MSKCLVIRYVHSIGGQFADRKFWEGQLDGELYDYGTKESLIAEAKSNGWDYKVMRHKRGVGWIEIKKRKTT